MKTFLTTTALAVSLITPALAGSPTAFVLEEPQVAAIAAEATDWSGPYAGGMVSFASGESNFSHTKGSRVYDMLDTTQYGGFLGYNFQRGNVVFGVEAAYLTGRMERATDSYYAYDWFADLKGRVGYAFGDALVYGVAGASWAGYDYDTYPETHNGFNYGIGVDYLITEKLFVGIEYLRRDVSLDTGHDESRGGEIQSIQVRAGLTF